MSKKIKVEIPEGFVETWQMGPITQMPFEMNVNWRVLEGDSFTTKCSYCHTTSDEKHQCPNCGAPK